MSATPPLGGNPSSAGTSPAGEDSVAKLIEIAHKPTLGQRLISWASRPPGRLYLPVCALVGLVLLYEDSVPGGHLPSLVVGVGGGALLAAMGALRLGIALTIARPMIRVYWLRWITAPLIAGLAIVLSVADVPLQTRLDLSARALLHVRDTVDRSTTIPMNGEWAGLYPLQAATVRDGVARFTVQGAGLLGTSGLAHSSEPLPTDVFVPGHGGVVYEHIKGDWYSWSEY
ncbi:hypothetical protein [Marinitenerispora sediminis]|uniref:Uncharacterized protein n=1 Tax=Marinitenerispora sediminis TaxID=1931232 RepID=A0A368TDX9_9ACTN|nr:hypothetical protein [Marinitenerispora sediminis]RCV56969.1 hypothetical protein DEF28_02520 [Marinitenerispora sediminis]RCV60174.1 hypothetical protein DEF23_05255 [Marinitenerispora sediminis]RCV62120.1 hypothetical protein DEF24_02430 [Marinitenerispora sediminis]